MPSRNGWNSVANEIHTYPIVTFRWTVALSRWQFGNFNKPQEFPILGSGCGLAGNSRGPYVKLVQLKIWKTKHQRAQRPTLPSVSGWVQRARLVQFEYFLPHSKAARGGVTAVEALWLCHAHRSDRQSSSTPATIVTIFIVVVVVVAVLLLTNKRVLAVVLRGLGPNRQLCYICSFVAVAWVLSHSRVQLGLRETPHCHRHPHRFHGNVRNRSKHTYIYTIHTLYIV